MKPLSISKLDPLAAASCAIFAVALYAAVIGFVCCVSTGLKPFGLNHLQRAVVGAAIGFCLGAVGVAVGGRRAWAFVGAVCGVCVAFFFAASMPLDNPKHTDSCGLTIVSFLICASVGLGIAGKCVGKRIGGRLELTPSRSGWLAPIANILHDSGLYERPLVLRLALALVQAAPILIAVPSLIRFFAVR